MIGLLLRLAARTLLRHPARSIITLGSIGLGVAALTFLGAIMVGVNDAMIANSIALHVGNVMIRSDDGRDLVEHWRNVSDLPEGVRAVLPRLLTTAMLSSGTETVSVQLAGVLPDREEGVSAVPARVEAGAYLSGSTGTAEIVIGANAADELHVEPDDSVSVLLPDGSTTTRVVAGVFETGIEQFDAATAYVHLDRMKRLDLPSLKGEVALFLRPGVEWSDVRGQIVPRLAAGETAVPWEKLLPELDQLLSLNLVSMLIVIVLVVIMMAAGVSNTVLVSVMNRYREFGVLKALGITPAELVLLVLFETAFICLVSGTVGLGAGALLTIATSAKGIDLTELTSENIHFVLSSVIHPRLTWQMAFAPAVTVLATALLASLWPAAIAARRRAAEVLRMRA